MGRNPNTLNEAHYDCNQNLHQQTKKQKEKAKQAQAQAQAQTPTYTLQIQDGVSISSPT